MTNIQLLNISAASLTVKQTTTQQASNAQFEAMMASFDTNKKPASSPLFGMAESMLDNILKSLSSVFESQNNEVDFPFTSSFVSTFGTSGPLPIYIAGVSAKLNLTSTQQTALQDIAVRNKDITKSPESVHKIAMELQAAGIGRA